MKQKKQAYEELVKIGGATPMGGSPAASQSLDQWLEGTPLAAPKAAAPQTPAPASGPKLGEVRTHLGVDYKFDGTKWVRQ